MARGKVKHSYMTVRTTPGARDGGEEMCLMYWRISGGRTTFVSSEGDHYSQRGKEKKACETRGPREKC